MIDLGPRLLINLEILFIGQPSQDYMPDDNLHLGKRKEGREREERSEAELLWEKVPLSAQNDRTHSRKVFLFANLKTTSPTRWKLLRTM